MKTLFVICFVILFGITACHKSNNTGGTAGQTFDSLETDIVRDFTNDVVFFRYSSLLNSSLSMQTGVNKLAKEFSL